MIENMFKKIALKICLALVLGAGLASIGNVVDATMSNMVAEVMPRTSVSVSGNWEYRTNPNAGTERRAVARASANGHNVRARAQTVVSAHYHDPNSFWTCSGWRYGTGSATAHTSWGTFWLLSRRAHGQIAFVML